MNKSIKTDLMLSDFQYIFIALFKFIIFREINFTFYNLLCTPNLLCLLSRCRTTRHFFYCETKLLFFPLFKLSENTKTFNEFLKAVSFSLNQISQVSCVHHPKMLHFKIAVFLIGLKTVWLSFSW